MSSNELDIGIHSGEIDTKTLSGVGHRIVNVVHQLSHNCSGWRIHNFGSLPGSLTYPGVIFHSGYSSNMLAKLLEYHVLLSRRAHTADVALLHCPKSIVPFGFQGKVTMTVHDLIFKNYPEQYPFLWKVYWNQTLRYSLSRADGIVAVSNKTKKELVHYFNVQPKRITVIPGGIDTSFFTPTPHPPSKEALFQKYKLPSSYFLYLGTFIPRKNLMRLLEAYDMARSEGKLPPLVLAGSGGEGERQVRQKISKLKLESSLTLPGYIDYQDLPGLYRNAEGFVYPPLDEGFGFPVLQAMACGTPIACSDLEPLREIGGELPVYFEPTNVSDISSSLRRLYTRAIRTKQKGPKNAKEYHWKKIGEAYRSFFESILK